MSLVVSATVVTEDQAQAARAAEAFARACTGLALEGIGVNLSIGTVDDEEEP
jgi:hypothetical protein